MRKKVALIIVVILAVPFVVAATKPDTFRVQRSATISAPADRIYPHIADFHAWTAWSPYEQLDPSMKRTYSGPTSGKGAAYAWDGNNEAGAGRMEIADVTPPNKVTIQLDFTKPFESHNMAEFLLEPQGSATKVTWAMSGPSPYMFKLMSLVMNMDDMIGKDFETGLANLKGVAER